MIYVARGRPALGDRGPLPPGHPLSWGAITAGTVLDVDLGGCVRFDSSLLSVLLELARHAAAAGATCRLHQVPSNLGKLAALYGADDLLFAPR